MFYTIPYIFLPYIPNCLLDQRLVAVLYESGQLLRPECLELLLNLAENELDRVVFRSIGKIIDEPDSEFSHILLGFFRRMHRKVVHKKAELFIRVGLYQFREVLLELLGIDRVLVDVKQLVAFLFTDPMK